MNKIRIILLSAAACLLAGCQHTVAESAAESSRDSAISAETSETRQTELYQGGEGDEAHANDPMPEYFTYRFTPDGISVRLAGGTYQAILYDLTDALQHHADQLFSLTDTDDDGDFDLSVPIRFDGDAASEYAVFLWDADTKRFADKPILQQTGGEIQTAT